MPAPAVLSAAGTWTPLQTDLSQMQDTMGSGQQGQLPAVAIADLTAASTTAPFASVPDEIVQMIKLAQAGWGTQLGANKRLDYWSTCMLLELFLQAHRTKGVRAGRDV